MIPGFPFRFSGHPLPQIVPAPDLGEHNQPVLERYLGYTEEQVAQLSADGILVQQRSGE
jgi:crotonobetainyl-CoA:carnitine CoA-transferase CaiB-like acyl-CoA transferase